MYYLVALIIILSALAGLFASLWRRDRRTVVPLSDPEKDALLANIRIQEESFERLQRLLLALPDLLLMVNGRNEVEYMNETAEKLTGFRMEEFSGRPFSDLVGFDENELNQPRGDDPRSEYRDREAVIITRDGQRLPVLVSTSLLISPAGENLGRLALIKNISQIKKLETQLTSQGEELQKANEELRALAAHRSRFLSHVSHELRSPLNSIMGFSGILLDEIPGSINEEQKKQLQVIYSQSERLLNQINELLDVARLQSRQLGIHRQPLKPENVIRIIVDSLQFQAHEKNLRLEYQPPETPLPEVMADPDRLEQILINLIGNAIRYTEKGKVWVQAHVVTDVPPMVEFRVSDTGVGIDLEDQQRLFDEFWQVQREGQESAGGLGLGLTITKQLVEMQGGEIGLESRPGLGTTFYFTIPVVDEMTDVAGKAARIVPDVGIIAGQQAIGQAIWKMLNARQVEAAWWKNAEELVLQLSRRKSSAGQPGAGILPRILIVDEPEWPEIETVLEKEKEMVEGAPGVFCLILSLDKEGTSNQGTNRMYFRKPIARGQLWSILQQRLADGPVAGKTAEVSGEQGK